MITLVFLGKLADLAGRAEYEFVPAGEMDWADLAALLGNHLNPEIAEAAGADKTKLALNGAVLADKTTLIARDGDEIAFLPPVSGG